MSLNSKKKSRRIFYFGNLVSFTRLSGFFTGLLLFGMMFAVMGGVILRYIFQRPVAGIDEIVGYIFSVSVFLGLAFTSRLDGHIRVDLFLSKASPKTQTYLLLFGSIIGLVISAPMVYFGSLQVIDSYNTGIRSWSPLKTPMYLAQIGIPVGFLLLFFEIIMKIIKSKRNLDHSNGGT